MTTEYRNLATNRRASLQPETGANGVAMCAAEFCVRERDAWSWRWRVVGTMRGERDVCEHLIRAWVGTQEAP